MPECQYWVHKHIVFMCCSGRKRRHATLSSARLELCGNFPIILVLSIVMAKGPKHVGLWKNSLCVCKKNFPRLLGPPPPLTWSSKSLPLARNCVPHVLLLLGLHVVLAYERGFLVVDTSSENSISSRYSHIIIIIIIIIIIK